MSFLGHDTTRYPRSKPKSAVDLDNMPAAMACSLRDLFASMPEIDDLFAEVFGGPPGRVSVAYDDEGNARGATALNAKCAGSLWRTREKPREPRLVAGLGELPRARSRAVLFRATRPSGLPDVCGKNGSTGR